MPKFKPATCKSCGVTRDEAERISNRALCEICGPERFAANVAAQRPLAESMKRNIAARTKAKRAGATPDGVVAPRLRSIRGGRGTAGTKQARTKRAS